MILGKESREKRNNQAKFKTQSTFFILYNLVTMYLVTLSHVNGLKMQKNSKNYEQQITNIAKTEISEAIKINCYYLNIMYLYFNIYLC